MQVALLAVIVKTFRGKFVSADKKISIGLPLNKRNKKLTDVLISAIFYNNISISFFFSKKTMSVFSEMFLVFYFLKKHG